MGTYANRGRQLEQLLEYVNEMYRKKRIAVIHKVPTEWLPIRCGGQFRGAKVDKLASVDFLGNYRGQPLAFDAKHTNEHRIRWDRVEPHQAQFLEDWERQNGISFVLLGYRMRRFFVVPWRFWAANKRLWEESRLGQASLAIDEIEPRWEVVADENKLPDYLAVVDRIFRPKGERKNGGDSLQHEPGTSDNDWGIFAGDAT